MKYSVTVAGKTYQVEIENLNTHPILARVDGDVFEVSPVEDVKPDTSQPALGGGISHELKASAPPEASPASSATENFLVAPLPGKVTEIFVKPGDQIEAGQVVIVIEAMKMKNSIRSTRGGKIAAVLVSAGQTIAHKQALVEFDD